MTDTVTPSLPGTAQTGTILGNEITGLRWALVLHCAARYRREAFMRGGSAFLACSTLALGCGGALDSRTHGATDGGGSAFGQLPGKEGLGDASASACPTGGCGPCTPGATQCSGNAVQTCGSDSLWGSSMPCPGSSTCLGGFCQTTDAPSCQTTGDGLTNCGAARESCCTSIELPGGTYNRTYTNDGGGPTSESDPATVSGFRFDKYLVTVGRFRQFVAAWNTGWTPPAGSGKHNHLNGGQGLSDDSQVLNNATIFPRTDPSAVYETGWQASHTSKVAPNNENLSGTASPSSSVTCDSTYATWTSTPSNHETHPIDCVNWYEAYAFCIWDGGFLASEAEWEYAAAGGSEEREYPWGSMDPGKANQYAIYRCYYPSVSGPCYGKSKIAPVGTAALGVARWGQLDLAGELWEWILDRMRWDPGSSCIDCAYLTDISGGVYPGAGLESLDSGGDFSLPLDPPRISGNYWDERLPIGIRCARSP
jgi:sulfatase modifying factor 1